MRHTIAAVILLLESTAYASTPPPLPTPRPPQIWTTTSFELPVDQPQPILAPSKELFDRLDLSPTTYHAMLASLLGPPVISQYPAATGIESDPWGQLGMPRMHAVFGPASGHVQLHITSDVTPGTAIVASQPDPDPVNSHEVTEPAMIAVRDYASVNWGITAYMRFPHPQNLKPRIQVANSSTFTSWTPQALALPHPYWLTNAYDQSGDPVLVENPYTTGLNPKRVYCVGTTFNMSNGRGDNQITAWFSDDEGRTWNAYGNIHHNFANELHFDDKPTAAVSWNASTLGYVYVAFVRVYVGSYGYANDIFVYALNPTTGAWDIRSSPVSSTNAISCPSLTVDSNTGDLYLAWVDWTANTISIKRSTDQGATFGITSAFAAGALLGNGNDSICDSSQTCIEGRSMINTRFNLVDRSVGLVYHRRKSGLDATVKYHRFLVSTQAWDSAGPWSVSGNNNHDQWNGALDYDSSGNYLVTYYDYDRGTAPSYITYSLWATTLAPSGGRSRDDHLNPSTNSNPRLTYTYIYPPGYYYLGEYQDVWNWFNGWNAATVAIQQSRGDIYVSVETP